ncbi:hypothetical protein [Bergeyella zoohelcum]|nr:hypothetical protein [Bergeyella zoohelcum]
MHPCRELSYHRKTSNIRAGDFPTKGNHQIFGDLQVIDRKLYSG